MEVAISGSNKIDDLRRQASMATADDFMAFVLVVKNVICRTRII